MKKLSIFDPRIKDKLITSTVPFGKAAYDCRRSWLKQKPYQDPYKAYLKESDEWLDKETRHERMQQFAHLLGLKLKRKHGASDVTLASYDHKRPRQLNLDTLVVPKDSRKRGVGSAVLKDLNKHADRHKLFMTLTLADKNKEWGTTSSNRLRKFYRRAGWVDNRGHKKKFDISLYSDMYRNPLPKPSK